MNRNKNFNKWLKQEKEEIQSFSENKNIIEIENGLKYEDEIGDEVIIEWNDELYHLLINDFSDCDYLYTYFYNNSTEIIKYDYFVDFIYDNKKFTLNFWKDDTNFVVETLYNEFTNFNSLSNEILIEIIPRFQLIVQMMLKLKNFRLKFLFKEEEKNILENLHETNIRQELIERNLLKEGW